jgi:hypothetical protein
VNCNARSSNDPSKTLPIPALILPFKPDMENAVLNEIVHGTVEFSQPY